MCTPSTSVAENGTLPGFNPLTRLWRGLGRGSQQRAETVDHLSPHLRRDIGLDDGRSSGRRTATDFTGHHGLAL